MEQWGLAHPRALEVTDRDGKMYRGGDQDWYRREWQRRAGCGPTAASGILCYLARTRGLEALGVPEPTDRAAFTALMERVWEDVKPGVRGLNRSAMFTGGIAAFARRAGVALSVRALEVPARGSRPTLEECAAFLRAGLEGDCPVAFLNLDNGLEERLDKWHWVLITALRTDGVQVLCTIADAGEEREIDLGLWRRTAGDLGAFVWAVPEGEGAL